MKNANIEEILGKKSEEESFESEGKIQDLFLGKKIRLLSATIGMGEKAEYARIILEDENAKERKTHTSSGVLVKQLKQLLENGLGEVAFPCTLTEKTSSDGYKYLTFL